MHPMLKGKKILLGITGSIAAYKIPLLVRLLVKGGAEVKVLMTPSATEFVSPLTLSTLSKNPVLYNISDEHTWANHVMLGRWADVMMVAPCSANSLAKMAKGICDNLLQAVYLSATCPVVVAPAMDEDMWLHPSTKKNIDSLISYGNTVIPAESGDLASGLVGQGRMPEPETLSSFLQEKFFRTTDLKGKRAVVTAGPTYEPIDPVRFIGNHSSGKMGVCLAEALYSKGAELELIIGPASIRPEFKGIKITEVQTAAEMFSAVNSSFENIDIAVMSAAVADYSPKEVSPEKIKKNDDVLSLSLNRTKDILKTIGENKKAGQLVIGFALETNSGHQFAIDKLKAKNADMIVLNSLSDSGAGFGHDTNKITVFKKDGDVVDFPVKSKKDVAADIVELIIQELTK